MSIKKWSALNGVLFFLFWLLVLLAGADKPPPPGFLWAALLVGACALIVAWRVPTYIAWQRTRRSGRFWRVAVDGLLAGLIAAALNTAGGGGEPSVSTQPADYAIWFAVLAVLGVLNALAIYGLNALLAARVLVTGGDGR